MQHLSEKGYIAKYFPMQSNLTCQSTKHGEQTKKKADWENKQK